MKAKPRSEQQEVYDEEVSNPLLKYRTFAESDFSEFVTDNAITNAPLWALAATVQIGVRASLRAIQLAWLWREDLTKSPTWLPQYLIATFAMGNALKRLQKLQHHNANWPIGNHCLILNTPGPSYLLAGQNFIKETYACADGEQWCSKSDADLAQTGQFSDEVQAWFHQSAHKVAQLQPAAMKSPDELYDEITRFQKSLQLEYDGVPTAGLNKFVCEGSVPGREAKKWKLRYQGVDGKEISTPAGGFLFLAYLLRWPDKHIAARELELLALRIPDTSIIGRNGASTSKKSGEPVHKGPSASATRADDKAVKEYKRRVTQLSTLIAWIDVVIAASETQDIVEMFKSKRPEYVDEMEQLIPYLTEANRPLEESDSAKARQRMHHGMSAARNMIADAGLPLLAAHLKNHIKAEKGDFIYKSDPTISWDFS
jgi:hypothetical protein